MKATALLLFCAFALALSDDEVQLNDNGCPVDFTIHKVLEHDTYCNLFYSCVSGERTELRCPADLVFNPEKDICDWPIKVDCGDRGISVYVPDSEEQVVENPGGNDDPSAAYQICAEEGSDGVLVAHENCNEFYKCDRGRPATVQCPEGLLYNSNVGYCDWPFNVECEDRLIPVLPEVKPEVVGTEPLAVYEACAKDETNELLLAHKNCNRFYKCSHGLPVVFSCPSGLVYNIEKTLCDWQYLVDCIDRPIAEDVEDNNNNNEESPSGGNGHSDPSQAPAICAAENSDGVLVANEICNQFYKCSLGVPVALDCPVNLLYNPELEICDWPQNVDCGSRSIIGSQKR